MAKLISTLINTSTPLLLLLLSASTFTFALQTTRPLPRLISSFLILCLVYGSAQLAKQNFGLFSSFTTIWTIYLINYVLHLFSFLFVDRYIPPVTPPIKETPTQRPNGQIIHKIWYNPRRRSPNVAIDADSENHLHRISSRYVLFFISNITKLTIFYLVHFHVLPAFFDETIVELQPQDVSPREAQFIRRLSEVTAREVVVRAYVASYWIWEGYFIFDGAHTLLACLFVAIGLDAPEDWPPIFGFPSEAVGMRRFWGSFWHRILVPTYTSYGSVVVRCLGLNPKSAGAKTIIAMMVFGISGLVHGAVAYFHGVPGADWNIWWFWLNFVACLAETVFIGLIRRAAASLGLSRELRVVANGWLGHFIGFAYVAAFFFWSVPKWKYPGEYPAAVNNDHLKRLLAGIQLM